MSVRRYAGDRFTGLDSDKDNYEVSHTVEDGAVFFATDTEKVYLLKGTSGTSALGSVMIPSWVPVGGH